LPITTSNHLCEYIGKCRAPVERRSVHFLSLIRLSPTLMAASDLQPMLVARRFSHGASRVISTDSALISTP
jgi:hypothetical protein